MLLISAKTHTGGVCLTKSNFINRSKVNHFHNQYWGATIVDEITKDGLCIKNNRLVCVRYDAPNDIVIPEKYREDNNYNLFDNCFTSVNGITVSDLDPNNKYQDDIDIYGATLCDTITEDGLCIRDNVIVGVKDITRDTYTIPDTVEDIADFAFSRCKHNIKSLTIPEKVKQKLNISGYYHDILPFYDCFIKGYNYDVEIDGMFLKQTGTGGKNNEFILYSITGVRDKSKESYKIEHNPGAGYRINDISPIAFKECFNLKYLDFTKLGIRNIYAEQFCGNGNLESVKLNNNYTNINTDSFSCCTKLNLNEFVKYYPNVALGDIRNCITDNQTLISQIGTTDRNKYKENIIECDEITSDGLCIKNGRLIYIQDVSRETYTIPPTCTRLDMNLIFSSCKNLKSLTIPDTVEEINDDIFRYCVFEEGKFINNSGIELSIWPIIVDKINDDGVCINYTNQSKTEAELAFIKYDTNNITIPKYVTSINVHTMNYEYHVNNYRYFCEGCVTNESNIDISNYIYYVDRITDSGICIEDNTIVGLKDLSQAVINIPIDVYEIDFNCFNYNVHANNIILPRSLKIFMHHNLLRQRFIGAYTYLGNIEGFINIIFDEDGYLTLKESNTGTLTNKLFDFHITDEYGDSIDDQECKYFVTRSNNNILINLLDRWYMCGSNFNRELF